MVKSKFLLDTHIFIWWMEKNKRLSDDLFDLINLSENEIFLSVATVWEIIIKKTKKKLKLSQDIKEAIDRNNFKVLPIEIAHILAIEKMPLIHGDPFDRILISQSKVEDLILITSDEKIWKYDAKILKA